MSAAASKSIGLAPGFADPIHDAQRTFRAVLAAMSRPGTMQALVDPPRGPAPLSPAMTAVALTLLDHETTVGLAVGGEDAAVKSYLAFHTGTRVVAPERAGFVLVADVAARPPLVSLEQGTPDYPGRSATLVLEAGALGEGPRVILSGPGIKDPVVFAASRLDFQFWREAAENHLSYPLGVDIILCLDGGRIAALPRSTRIEV